MRIAIGSHHAGFALKEGVKVFFDRGRSRDRRPGYPRHRPGGLFRLRARTRSERNVQMGVPLFGGYT